MSQRLRIMFWVSFFASVGLYWWYGLGRPDPERLNLPDGFHVAVYAEVAGARSLALGTRGTVFVSTRRAGKVYGLVDGDGDNVAETVHVLAEGLDSPNGVAFRDGALYVAEISRILRFDDIESHLEDPPAAVVVYDGFPTETHHGWKFIRFGPDGLLYVPIGAPCNICLPADERFMSILRMQPDGSDIEIYASGVRYSVGFDWHPETGVLWFTDNGRDNLGDDRPPDELNRAPEAYLHFGFPFCHGGIISDPEYGTGHDCNEYMSPALALDAHVAPLGMRFYDGAMFPPEYRHRILIAQHGSWNRSVPDGYRIIAVTVVDGVVVASETFMDGWLEGGRAWGRPVDVEVMPDGAVLVSDDRAGLIYRVTYDR